MNIELILPIIIGFFLDLIVGDPYTMPHPIKLFGHIISYVEKKLNSGNNRLLKGALTSILLTTITYLSFNLIKYLISFDYYTQLIITSLFIFYGLANRSLIMEVLKVNKVLTEEGLEAGRKQLGFIVGRDTKNLDEQAIRKASLETLAENLSDGVIAPLFYLFLGGFPLMMSYKMINTLDSMIGYKNERFKDFGFMAAKTDDIFNFIPARITAFLIALVSFKPKSLSFIFKYAKNHTSPNAGYPESAMAGALDCKFGGPSEYFSEIVYKPFIGKNNNPFTFKKVQYACCINIKASIVFLTLGIISLIALTPYIML